MDKKRFVIGIDLGGTNTVFGLISDDNRICATHTLSTQSYDYAWQFVDDAVRVINDLSVMIGGTDALHAVGIGAPAGNFCKGTVEHAANIKWAKGVVPLCRLIAEQIDVPVAITNDAKAAALGEMRYGVARGMNNFIEITLGTGVGSGIVAGGQLVYGSDGLAGELGHTIIDFSSHGRSCGCGRSGCLDMYCSTRGVLITLGEVLSAKGGTPSILRDMKPQDISTLDIYRAAEAGDILAQETLRITGETLGKACANFATFLSPEAFVFFGGLAKAGHWLLDPARQAYDRYVLHLYRGKAQFLESALEDGSAAILGAAAVAWNTGSETEG